MRIINPYEDLTSMQSYKASFHNHTMSRGRITAAPYVAAGIYRLCGINIVAITDHDRRLGPDEDQVSWCEEEWQHSYEDLLLIHGFEASFPADHVNVLGCWPHDVPLTPEMPGFVETAHKEGAFSILNHPAKWNATPDHVTDDPNLSRCKAIEIYNGARLGRGKDRALATPLWDACLSHGLKIWAVAGSDCHRYDFSIPGNPNNGWNVLWLPELTVQEVFNALAVGRFYASSGLEIDEVSMRNESLYVRASKAACMRFIGNDGVTLKETQGTEASYTPQNTGYIRVELDGLDPPFPGADTPMQAWLQPIWVEEM